MTTSDTPCSTCITRSQRRSRTLECVKTSITVHQFFARQHVQPPPNPFANQRSHPPPSTNRNTVKARNRRQKVCINVACPFRPYSNSSQKAQQKASQLESEDEDDGGVRLCDQTSSLAGGGKDNGEKFLLNEIDMILKTPALEYRESAQSENNGKSFLLNELNMILEKGAPGDKGSLQGEKMRHLLHIQVDSDQ